MSRKEGENIVEAEGEQEIGEEESKVGEPERIYERYYDTKYKSYYYYNPKSKITTWSQPNEENSEIIDKSNLQGRKSEENVINITQIDTVLPKKRERKYSSGSENEHEEREHVKTKKLMADYPEYYNKHDDNISLSSEEGEEVKDKFYAEYDEHVRAKEKQVEEWMKRPARQQITELKKETGYQEGNYDYNIWYDKYLTDRSKDLERPVAEHKLHLELGYTKADITQKSCGWFCIYFAKGECIEGANCRYYHRTPQSTDLRDDDQLRDCFGRVRHATFKEDMSGIGTFSHECRSLYIADLRMNESSPTPVKEMVSSLYDHFKTFGVVEDVNFLPFKSTGFVRFKHRYYAEFAREAMQNQPFGLSEIITVKWAHEDPNPRAIRKHESEQGEQFLQAHLRKKKQRERMGASEQNKIIKEAAKVEEAYSAALEVNTNLYNPGIYEGIYNAKERAGVEGANEAKTLVMDNCNKLNEVLGRITQAYGDNQD